MGVIKIEELRPYALIGVAEMTVGDDAPTLMIGIVFVWAPDREKAHSMAQAKIREKCPESKGYSRYYTVVQEIPDEFRIKVEGMPS